MASEEGMYTMCAEIKPITSEQWQHKVAPLKNGAYSAFSLLQLGYVNANTVHFARGATPEEIAGIDWLGYLSGIPDDIVPPEVWASRAEDVVQLVNAWLVE